MSEETVTISKSEYQRLKDDQEFLECLSAAGVDNWEGYTVAVQEYAESHPEQKQP